MVTTEMGTLTRSTNSSAARHPALHEIPLVDHYEDAAIGGLVTAAVLILLGVGCAAAEQDPCPEGTDPFTS